MGEGRLHTLAGAERFPSPADWLAELARAAAAFPVAPNVPASEVLFTDPASWRSGEVRKRLDARAQKWPKSSPPCGFLCWVAHDVEGRDVNGKTRGVGQVRVTSPVVSPVVYDKRVEGPYLFLGALERSADGSGWECRMAYAQPIASLQLPIPVESEYERRAVLSLVRLVRDLRSDTKLGDDCGTCPQAAHRTVAVLRDRSRAGGRQARLIPRPRCSSPAGRGRGWVGRRVTDYGQG